MKVLINYSCHREPMSGIAEVDVKDKQELCQVLRRMEHEQHKEIIGYEIIKED